MVRERGFMVIAAGNCADGIVQNALPRPTLGQFLILRRGRFLAYDISGTMREELPKRLSRSLIERRRF